VQYIVVITENGASAAPAVLDAEPYLVRYGSAYSVNIEADCPVEAINKAKKMIEGGSEDE